MSIIWPAVVLPWYKMCHNLQQPEMWNKGGREEEMLRQFRIYFYIDDSVWILNDITNKKVYMYVLLKRF